MKQYCDSIMANVIVPLKNLLSGQSERLRQVEEERLKLSQELDKDVAEAEAAAVEYKKAMEEFERVMDIYTKEEAKTSKKLPKKEQMRYVQRINRCLSVQRSAEARYKSLLFTAKQARSSYYEKIVHSLEL